MCFVEQWHNRNIKYLQLPEFSRPLISKTNRACYVSSQTYSGQAITGKNYKRKPAWGFYFGPLHSCFRTHPTHSSFRGKSRTGASSQAVRSGMLNLGHRGSRAWAAGRSSPDALGAEDQARPLREGAEAHAVEPDQPRGHRARRRAAWGESRGAVTAGAPPAAQPCRPRAAYPCPGCGSDRPTSQHDGSAPWRLRSVTAPPQPGPGTASTASRGTGVRPRLRPRLPPGPGQRCCPTACPVPAPWAGRRPTQLGRELFGCCPCSPSTFTKNYTNTSGIPLEIGNPRPDSTTRARCI